MQLTKSQRRNLELYATYRSAPPTFWSLFRHNLPRLVFMALLVFLLYLLAPTAGTEWLALIATGLFLGVLGRDIGRFWQFVRMWPALAAVLDWQRLDMLLNSPDAAVQETLDD
ncbi:MAG TPA: hypothetical protein VLE70_16240 [Anaerolineae bacterium]|jgi:hypothetical protein|nr:hypothetical protein [Anaerolineae bacterium]